MLKFADNMAKIDYEAYKNTLLANSNLGENNETITGKAVRNAARLQAAKLKLPMPKFPSDENKPKRVKDDIFDPKAAKLARERNVTAAQILKEFSIHGRQITRDDVWKYIYLRDMYRKY